METATNKQYVITSEEINKVHQCAFKYGLKRGKNYDDAEDFAQYYVMICIGRSKHNLYLTKLEYMWQKFRCANSKAYCSFTDKRTKYYGDANVFNVDQAISIFTPLGDEDSGDLLSTLSTKENEANVFDKVDNRILSQKFNSLLSNCTERGSGYLNLYKLLVFLRSEKIEMVDSFELMKKFFAGKNNGLPTLTPEIEKRVNSYIKKGGKNRNRVSELVHGTTKNKEEMLALLNTYLLKLEKDGLLELIKIDNKTTLCIGVDFDLMMFISREDKLC